MIDADRDKYVRYDATRSIAREAIAEPQMQALYDYWRSKWRDGRAPGRPDIDPVDIPRLLKFLMLVDVFDQGRSFRFRVVGTDVAYGVDPTGLKLEESVPDGAYKRHIVGIYAAGARARRALYTQFSYGYNESQGPRTITRLFLPLVGDEGAVAMMLVGQMRQTAAVVRGSAWQLNPDDIHPELVAEIV